MDAAIATGETKTVRVERPIPVLVIYWTIDPRVGGPDGLQARPLRTGPDAGGGPRRGLRAASPLTETR